MMMEIVMEVVMEVEVEVVMEVAMEVVMKVAMEVVMTQVMCSHIEKDFFVNSRMDIPRRGMGFFHSQKNCHPHPGVNFSASAEKIEMFFLVDYD